MVNTLLLIGLLVVQTAHAQTPRISADTCRDAMHTEIQREHQIFRSVILGNTKAEDADIAEVRIDFIGRAWYKVGEDEWRSTETDIVFTDVDMDAQTPGGVRRGLFETRGVLTSHLIPYLGQSMRALQCNLDLICDQVNKSMLFEQEDPQDITANALGCIKREASTLVECHFLHPKANKVDRADLQSYCPQVTEELMKQEAGIISMAVSYDAAYRTILQFAGNFDLFLQEFRLPLISTLRDAVNLIGGLNRIPCFVASCDSYPPPEDEP